METIINKGDKINMANTIPQRSMFDFLATLTDAFTDEIQSTNSPFPEKRWCTTKKRRGNAKLVIWFDECMKKALMKSFTETPDDFETKSLQKHMMSWFMDRQHYLKAA